jgi:hypothetical protein
MKDQRSTEPFRLRARPRLTGALPTRTISSTEPDHPRSFIQSGPAANRRRFPAFPTRPVNARVAYGLQDEGGLSAALRKSLQIDMELAGLEPATSWVRSRRSPS